ncbi:MAG: F0F1 ATP synthase subunit B [Ruminococcus sp.]|nr:F0F1 ATP synthase subunit B [Ruminococcus sp.]MCD7800173.1 F0F1 ATP synthase subunit B [Ruminococcus sp.]
MLDFLSIDVGSIIFTLLNTLILFLVLKHFLFGRVNKVLEDRQNEVSSTYKNADATLENANQLKSQYTELMAGAKEEGAEIVQNAIKKAQHSSDDILANAKSEAQHIIERANLETERELKKAKAELQDEVSDMAMLMAEKIVQREINKADHEKLINDFIDKES